MSSSTEEDVIGYTKDGKKKRSPEARERDKARVSAQREINAKLREIAGKRKPGPHSKAAPKHVRGGWRQRLAAAQLNAIDVDDLAGRQSAHGSFELSAVRAVDQRRHLIGTRSTDKIVISERVPLHVDLFDVNLGK